MGSSRDDQPDRKRDTSRDTLLDDVDEETKVGSLSSSKLRAEMESVDEDTMVKLQPSASVRSPRADLRVPPPVPYAPSESVVAARPPSDPPTLEMSTEHLPPLRPDPADAMMRQIDERMNLPTRPPPPPHSLSVATPFAPPPALPRFLPQFLGPREMVTSDRVAEPLASPRRRRRIRRSVILPWPSAVMLVAIVVAKIVEHVRRGDLIETIVAALRAVVLFFQHLLG